MPYFRCVEIHSVANPGFTSNNGINSIYQIPLSLKLMCVCGGGVGWDQDFTALTARDMKLMLCEDNKLF